MDSLTVPGNLDSLQAIRDFVLAAAEEAGIDERSAYKLSLAVDEIATNIIIYGYGGSATPGDVVVQADTEDRRLQIVLEDTSPPFDPFSRGEPSGLDAPLEERAIGGLGVYLAKRSVDEFRYEYVDGRNRNIFVVNRSTT
ncbi:MAG: ATP-binding protein [Chloroflexota bacterium]|nr:ATP-binding protein [Chloroflexota bacterium]